MNIYNQRKTKVQKLTKANENWVLHHIIWCEFWFIPKGSPVIAKLATTTELAMAAKKTKSKTTLLSKYSKFTLVFSKQAMEHISPSCSYDHEINLDESFISKVGKIYPLSSDEWTATEAFLDKNLWAGKIHPSNSPQASSFFFVKKKDGGLQPCQDYHYINKYTIWDAYHLPLIPDLIEKLHDTKVFSKFDVCWGYNNVWIEDGHQWKVALITHKGFFNPIMMFFGLTNSPTTF